MKCRIGCAACCEFISISSSLPGFPGGKPGGVRCQALDSNGLCTIWETDEYPPVCRSFRADPEYCGRTDDEARRRLADLEKSTSPS